MYSQHIPKCLGWILIGLAAASFAQSPSASVPREKLLYSFQGPTGPNGQDGEGPGDLISDEHGNLYGVTQGGGICLLPHTNGYPCGTVFELSPPAAPGGSWTETVLYEFGTNFSEDGNDPRGNLIRDNQGNLFGVTATNSGGFDPPAGCGNLFELSPPAEPGEAWTETIVYQFQGGADGCGPSGTLVRDSKGNIFGTTNGGGDGDAVTPKTLLGGIFELSPPSGQAGVWTEAFTQSLGGGNQPTGALAIDAHGVLYGSTSGTGIVGGPATIFKLIPPASAGGAFTSSNIYNFQGGTDGSAPGGLTIDAGGNLYGVTQDGGTAGAGTAFRLAPPKSGSTWTKTTLYSFKGGNDGFEPIARMTFDKSGNLYGTTIGGGLTPATCSATQGCGTVFKLTRSATGWSEQVVYRFKGLPTDGFQVFTPVLLAGPSIFGTTATGGTATPNSYGTVFQIK